MFVSSEDLTLSSDYPSRTFPIWTTVPHILAAVRAYCDFMKWGADNCEKGIAGKWGGGNKKPSRFATEKQKFALSPVVRYVSVFEWECVRVHLTLCTRTQTSVA